jgi:diguanylate cyclase (GGDEF)-like protein
MIGTPSPANIVSSGKPRVRIGFRNLLIASIVGIFTLVLASAQFDGLGSVGAWARGQDVKYVLILALAVFAVVVGIFSLRGRGELVHEITGRARVEEALGESEAKLIQIEQRTRDMTLLSEMAQLLQASRSMEEAYTVIGQHLQRLFPHEAGAVCVLSASRNFVEAIARGGEPRPTERVFAPDDCWALRRGQTHVVSDIRSGALCKHVHHAQSVGYLCVPMMAQTEALGILHLQMAPQMMDQPERIREREVESTQRLAVTVAGQIGLALGNLKLSEALRVQSMRDVLTGLFNRRYMEESLERELRRAVREQGPLGVIMLDVDHFKRLNDTSGHDAGDMILRALGHCMQEITRGYDIACRYGGEEFTLILPNAPLSVAVERAEQLREKFKHLDVEHQGHSLAPGTLSLGVAGFPEHGSSMEHILRAADVALYRAKNEGRDRVVIAGAGVVARTGG